MTVETEFEDVKVEQEEGQEEQGGSDNTNKEEEKKEEEKEKSYTQEEVEKMISDRVAREKRNAEKAIQESEKLAKMNTDQKREYEFEKLQEENKRLKSEQNKYSLGKEATKMLAESNIIATDDILDFVVREDAEKTSEAVKAFSDLVDKVSDERMKEKLKGKSPKKQTNSSGAFTKETIMSIKDGAERIKAIQENQHLFN